MLLLKNGIKNLPKDFLINLIFILLGKVIEWYFIKNEILDFKEVKILVDKSCELQPSNRINYVSFLESLSKITSEISSSQNNTIYLNTNEEIIEDLNNARL